MEILKPNVAAIANRMEIQPSFLRYETREKLWSIHRRTFVSDTDKTLMEVAAQNLLGRGFAQDETTKIIQKGLRGLEQYSREVQAGLDIVYITEMVRIAWHHPLLLENDIHRMLIHYEPFAASTTLLQLIGEQIKGYNIVGVPTIDIMLKGMTQLRSRFSRRAQL